MVINGMDFNACVAAELRAERGAKKLTVKALAERSNMVKGTLLRYLNGEREIPIPALYNMATALGVEPREIMDRAKARAIKADAESPIAPVTPIGVGGSSEPVDLRRVPLKEEDLAADTNEKPISPDRGN